MLAVVEKSKPVCTLRRIVPLSVMLCALGFEIIMLVSFAEELESQACEIGTAAGRALIDRSLRGSVNHDRQEHECPQP